MCKGNDIFLSYGHRDAEIATELASRLKDAGFSCFLAERDISATQHWEPRLRDEIKNAKCVLLLLTPRSRDSTWVAIETGAAWVLEKVIVPATMFVEAGDLPEPITRYQVRRVETSAQTTTLVQELQNQLLGDRPVSKTPADHAGAPVKEEFSNRANWDRLQKIGAWEIDETTGVFHGDGEHHYLLSHFTYGSIPFAVKTRLLFTELRPRSDLASVNAGVVFGWRALGDVRRYFHLMFTGEQVLLELVGDNGGPVWRDFQHLDDGVPLPLQVGHSYDIELSVANGTLSVTVDGGTIYSIEFAQDPTGRVGLRPWRSRIESDRFDVMALDSEWT